MALINITNIIQVESFDDWDMIHFFFFLYQYFI